MTRRLAIALLGVLVGSLLSLLVLNRPRPVEAPPAGTKRPGPPKAATAAPPPEAPREPVVLFFEDENDLLLHRELQQVPVPEGAVGRIHGAVAGLLRGSSIPGRIRNIPPGSEVRAIYLAPPGLVTVDLDIPEAALASVGAHQEWMAVESLAATVLEAAPAGTSGILVTVRGETPETFGGHADLTRPIRVDPRLVSAEPPVAVTPTPPRPLPPAAAASASTYLALPITSATAATAGPAPSWPATAAPRIWPPRPPGTATTALPSTAATAARTAKPRPAPKTPLPPDTGSFPVSTPDPESGGQSVAPPPELPPTAAPEPPQ